jgi:hypothetical protein
MMHISMHITATDAHQYFENAFEEKLRELKGFLVKRGYNSDDDQFGRVREVDRNNLLMRKEGAKAPFTLHSIFGTVPLFGSWTT